MLSKYVINNKTDKNKEFRFFGILISSPPFHFYMMQLVGFFYFGYRFASRNYTVYGLLPDQYFNYPREQWVELLPTPLLHFTTFQFIYKFIPRPTVEMIYLLQCSIILACILGLVGVMPKWNAVIAFIIGSHLTGMMQSSNAEIDGGTLALAVMLILALSPSQVFYSVKNGLSFSKRSVDYHWPLFLLLLVVGSFYTYAGLNKIVHIGPHWPFVFHLERVIDSVLEDSLFVSSRYRNPWLADFYFFRMYLFSVLTGLVTLVGELFFISILFIPRYRLFFIVSMATMHILVYYLRGINFVGSSVILFLCLDWNVMIRQAEVYYDDKSSFCMRSLKMIKRFDWFGRVEIYPMSKPLPREYDFDSAIFQKTMGLRDENGEIYYGADAFEQIAARCPLFWPFALLMKVPGAIYVARYVYAMIARNRMTLGCNSDGVCALPLKEGAKVSTKE